MSRNITRKWSEILSDITTFSVNLRTIIAEAVLCARVTTGGDSVGMAALRNEARGAFRGSLNTFNQYWADCNRLSDSKLALLFEGKLTERQANAALNRRTTDAKALGWSRRMDKLFAQGTARQQAAWLARH